MVFLTGPVQLTVAKVDDMTASQGLGNNMAAGDYRKQSDKGKRRIWKLTTRTLIPFQREKERIGKWEKSEERERERERQSNCDWFFTAFVIIRRKGTKEEAISVDDALVPFVSPSPCTFLLLFRRNGWHISLNGTERREEKSFFRYSFLHFSLV